MKRLFFITSLLLIGLVSQAQDTSKKVTQFDVFQKVKPSLDNAFTIISTETPVSDVKTYFKNNKNVLVRSRDGKVVYTYKMSFDKSGDILQVNTKATSTDLDFLKTYENVNAKEQKLLVRVKYICTDAHHSPKHEANSQAEMQAIVAKNKCSGYTMITDSPLQDMP